MDPANLQRFVDAQKNAYPVALEEIKAGRKRSHWMWYIFPQIAGLGYSEISRYYAIANRQEAEEYLQHPLLGQRLVTISSALLAHKGKSALSIFGSPDDIKLKSSMTLFASLPAADPVFTLVLQRFFNGEPDHATLRLLQKEL